MAKAAISIGALARGLIPAAPGDVPKRADDRRPSAARRGYGRRWQRESKRFLAAQPLCVACEREGLMRAATVVDHRIPHRGNALLFWDRSNWQVLCTKHHNQKTARGE